MRPANQHQAEQHMQHLLNRKLKGNRSTKVKEHTTRAKLIAATIWQRFNVGPYQYQVKHLCWYLTNKTPQLKPASRYRHWLTIRNIVAARNKSADWLGQLQGDWQTPASVKTQSSDNARN
jgi:hypothetical protein